MRRRAPRFPVSTAASLLAVAVPCLALAAPASAQEPAAGGSAPSVSITTEGVYASFHPRAILSVSRDAHVAVFEVEPGVGAVKLYPYASGRSETRAAGTHEFALSGVRAANFRDQFLAHLGHRLRYRGGHHPDAYLLAVASERPLELSGLMSGRVFAYRGGGVAPTGASVGAVVTALLEAIVPGPGAGSWDYDLHAYSKFRDPGLAAGFGSSAAFYGDAAAFGCLTAWGGSRTFEPWGFNLGWRGFGFGSSTARDAFPYLSVSLSPISYNACRGFGFALSRLATASFGWGWPYLFAPHRPPQTTDRDDETGKPGIMDPTGITVGEPLPAGPTELPRDGMDAGTSRDRQVRDALLARIADARADGRVTVEEVRTLVRDRRLDLPRSLPERMRVEAFRRDRIERERAERERRERAARWGGFGRSDRGFAVPTGIGRGDAHRGGIPSGGAPDRAGAAAPGRPDRPAVRRPSRPARGAGKRPRPVKDDG